MTLHHRLLILCGVVLLAGCARSGPTLDVFGPLPENASCRVALLPLADRSNYPQGGAIFYKIFLSELVASGRYQVVPEGDILEIYQQLMIYPSQLPSQEQLEIIGGRLGVSLFISGEILSMREPRSGVYMQPELTLILRLHDGRTGAVLWSTYHRRLGTDYHEVLHFGRINTIAGLARRMTREIITLWHQKGLAPCP
ncbi:hypothetical protein GF1_26510 [Desulfolithobacter dissulfuricans]|uniref:Lipoprotein n=1 Tax=Desulfolithobacter dissulfuricans TaxID=2795293 RepID=A0A915U3P6_9BACT|nr:hypothetical protein [Desulfolithobacter dissulfuricans]BCO10275.1 hypothetical protein GF1_26510 [Desulfolithobacter dissulfuricans]